MADEPFLDRLRADVDAEMQTLIGVATHEVAIRDANEEYRRRRRAIRSELRNLGLDDPNPWPDLWKWYGHYSADQHLTTYQARREFVLDMYRPLLDALEGLEERKLGTGIRPGPTGWTDVDRQVAALERAYARARTPEDFRQIGLLCRDIFISLGHVVFDPEKHLPPGAPIPKGDDAKQRLEYAIGAEHAGKGNEESRALVRAMWSFVQPVVHSRTGDETQAMIAAETTISLQRVIARLFPDPAGRLPEAGEDEQEWEPSPEDVRWYVEHMIEKTMHPQGSDIRTVL